MRATTSAALAAFFVTACSTGFATHAVFGTSTVKRGYHLVNQQDDDSRGANHGTQEHLRMPSQVRWLVVLGTAATFSVSVLSLFAADRNWFSFWVTTVQTLLGLQAVLFSGVWSTPKAFAIGVCIALSSFSLLGLLTSAIYADVSQDENGFDPASKWPIFIQAALACAIAAAALAVPHDVVEHHNGLEVDRQNAVSVAERYTFSWAAPLLRLAVTRTTLEYEDLPALDKHTRAASVIEMFFVVRNLHRDCPLWRQIMTCHLSTFVEQWTLTLAESVLLYGPQICMFRMLMMLESLDRQSINKVDLWFWVLALGVTGTALLFVQNWLQWINFSILAIPVRSQLSALIFDKAMRMRDIKETAARKRARRNSTSSSEETRCNGTDEELGEDDKAKKETEASITSTHQTIINLLGVDAQRVSDFCSWNNLLPGTVFNISIAVWFLVRLIGWISVIAGLIVPLLFIPLNTMATKVYIKAQGDLMEARDKKTEAVKEPLQGIRQIKFAASEDQWQAIILEARERELAQQWRVYAWATLLMFCWISAPILLGASSIGTYAWLNDGVSPAVAFTALSVFTKLEWSLSVIPTTITELMDAIVSLRRIQKYLESADKPDYVVAGDMVALENATITWPNDSSVDAEEPETHRFQLTDVDLSFPKGEVSIINGRTGSGKSLLLLAIAGEAEILKGRVLAPRYESGSSWDEEQWIQPGATSLVSQIPWLESGSIRANILFGLPMKDERYQKTLAACALLPDLDILPDGDLTEIGASGINLSGGQRWRVTIARALYSRASILLLDDIFSAVDAHVGRHLLENALDGDLAAGRTRILVTHHMDLVSPRAVYTVTLGNGRVLQAAAKERTVIPTLSVPVEESSEQQVENRNSDATHAAPKVFVEQESRETGQVKWSVYRAYLQAFGGWGYGSLVLGTFTLAQSAILGRAWWVELWTRETRQGDGEGDHDGGSHLAFYLSVYLGLSFVAAAIGTAKVYLVCIGTVRAARALFENLVRTVLRAPMRWHDTAPVGRVLNRFVGDFALIDSRFAGDNVYFWTSVFAFSAIIIAAVMTSPVILLPALLLGWLVLYYANFYLAGARGVKRLEANAKSPIFELFGTALAGIGTVRVFGKASMYRERMFDRIDVYARSTWNICLTARWMSLRIGALGTAFGVCVAVTVTYFDTSAAMAGFALGFALDYAKVVVDTIRRFAGIELDMNSTERVLEYSEGITTEDQDGTPAPPGWPWQGAMSVKNLTVAYASDLPPALHGLTFHVEPRQRVGIVGRTGSGKSSLTLALFRFLEARDGWIEIDGVDISNLRLRDLRHSLAIIPQDPVLFSGTIRSNLDPFHCYRDATIHETLRQVHLGGGGNTSPFDDLDSKVAEGGLNFSQGQRQLLCMARAIITKPKILVLDEATSALDMHTDVLIQESVRTHFQDCTLLVIAHRLSTVADFDKILVLDDGHVAEYDTPQRLLQNRGIFWELVKQSGDHENLEAIIGGAN